MAVKYPSNYRSGFLGSKSYLDCDKIDVLLDRVETDKGQGIKKYSKAIYDLTEEDVKKVIETGSTSGVDFRTGSLRGYQTFGVHFMLLAKNAILTDSVGLGKTAQISALINILDKAKHDLGYGSFKYIFVTELGLIEQAQKELVRFTGKPVLTSTGQAKDVKLLIEKIKSGDFTGLVCSYSLISSFEFMSFLNDWVSKNEKLDYLFVDESAVLRNKITSTYKMFTQLRDKLTKHRVLMNATPFESDIYTVYSQLDFVDPTMLPNKGTFDKMFVKKNPLTGYISGYKDPKGFKQAVRFHMFGQTRNELGVSVENSAFELLMYDLTNTQRKLLQHTNYPAYVFDNPSWLDNKIPFTEETVPKAKALMSVWREKILPNKVVVYCKYKEAQEHLKNLFESEGYQALILNGEDNSSKKKAEKVEAFRSDDYDVLITNIQKGLNLEFVNHLIFYSFSSNSGMMNQVEGRIIRSQKIHNKHIYLIVGKIKEYSVIKSAATNSIQKASHTKTDVSLLSVFLKYSPLVVDECKEDNSFWLSHMTCPIYSENGEYVLDYELDYSLLEGEDSDDY